MAFFGKIKHKKPKAVNPVPENFLEAQLANAQSVSASGDTSALNWRDPREGSGIQINSLESHRHELFDMCYNNYRYTSKIVSIYELKQIERLLIKNGMCAILKPVFYTNNNVPYFSEDYRVYPCTINKFNSRNETAEVITITHVGSSIEKSPRLKYSKLKGEKSDKFAVITCNPTLGSSNLYSKMWTTIEEYAQALYDIDRAIQANIGRLCQPVVGIVSEFEHVNSLAQYSNAMQNNSAFVTFTEKILSKFLGGKIFQNIDRDNQLEILLKAKQMIKDDFGRKIGVNTREVTEGSYVAESVQTENIAFTKYKRFIGMCNRATGIQEANQIFGLDLNILYNDVRDINKNVNEGAIDEK
jgi:hypothetical protein